MERNRKLEEKSGTLVLIGNEHTVMLAATHSFWNREVSHGYGNAYVRDARYQELRGVGLITRSDGSQLEMVLEGGDYETGRPFGAVTSLEEVFPFSPIYEDEYADFIAQKIYEEIDFLSSGNPDSTTLQQSFIKLDRGNTPILDLKRFKEVHIDDHMAAMRERGILAEDDGQIRFPLSLVE